MLFRCVIISKQASGVIVVRRKKVGKLLCLLQISLANTRRDSYLSQRAQMSHFYLNLCFCFHVALYGASSKQCKRYSALYKIKLWSQKPPRGRMKTENVPFFLLNIAKKKRKLNEKFIKHETIRRKSDIGRCWAFGKEVFWS